MAGVKIADLYAQIGVKVDSSKLQTFLIKLSAVKMRVNQLSAALNNANRSMSNSYGMQSAAERLKAAQQRTIAAQYNAQAAASRAAAAAARAANVANRPTSQRQPSRARVSMGSGGMGMSGLMAAPASLVASLGGVYALTSSFVNVNKQVGNFRAGMLLSSSSAAEASGQIAWLKTKASELGIAYRGATQDFTQFSATTSAMGATQSQTRVMYNDIMKIQTALAMTPDQAEGMTRALTQMVSKGKVMSEELKGQLAERVPGAVAIMAKAMGKTVPELFEMMKDGALNATEAVPKFLEVYAKLAQDSGALKEAQGGLAFSINNLDTAWFQLMETLGDMGIKDLLKGALDWLTAKLNYLVKNSADIKIMFVDMYDNTMKLADSFIKWGTILGVFAIAMGVAALAVWVMNGGLYAMLGAGLSRLIGFFVSLGTSTAFAAGGFWAMLLPVLALGLLLASFFLIWQDLTSTDSWLLNWSNDANILQKAITGLYDAFTKIFEVSDQIAESKFGKIVSSVITSSNEAGNSGVGAGGRIGLTTSQRAAAGSGSTTNSGGNLNIGVYNAKAGETPADTGKGFRMQGIPQASLGNTAAN